jgi:hypothetical protein
VQRLATVDRRVRYRPCTPENPEGIPIHGEYVAPEAVEKHAAGPFPRQTRKPREDALRTDVVHLAKSLQRKLSEFIPYCYEKLLDRLGLLPVKTASSQHVGDLGDRRLIGVLPSREGATKASPRIPESRQVGLEAQNDVHGLIEGIRLIAEHRLRCSVRSIEHVVD